MPIVSLKINFGCWYNKYWLIDWLVHLTAHQMNPGALSIEPRLTLKWTPTHFLNEPRSPGRHLAGALFSKLKNPKKKIKCLKNQNNNWKSHQSTNIFSSLWSKVNFQLGNPLKVTLLPTNSFLHSINLFHKYLFRKQIIKYFKMAGFSATGGIFSSKMERNTIFQ